MLLFIASLASAGTPLAWHWPEGQVHRYIIANQVDLSAELLVAGEENQDERVLGWMADLNLLCTGVSERKRAFEVSCVIEDFRMRPKPLPGDRNQIQAAVDAWDRMLTGARIELVLRPDGRLTDYSLAGVDTKNANLRTRWITQVQREVLGRSLAGLEVVLPKKGELASSWQGTHGLAMTVPSTVGTVGAVDLRAKATAVDEREVTLAIAGEGTRGPRIDGPANLWRFAYAAEAVFDRRRGVLKRQEVRVRGELTPSSPLAVSMRPLPYVQTIAVRRLEPTTQYPAFGPNEVLTDE